MERAIESVKNQSYKDWELLIVDDGSIDNIISFITGIIASEPRIRLLSREKTRLKGPSTCRNIGIEIGRGQFIAFLDSDDYWLPNRLENICNFIQDTQAEAVYSGAEIKRKDGLHPRFSRSLEIGESLFDFVLKNNSFIPTPSLVVKAWIAKKSKFNECLTHHEDYDFFIRVGDFCEWKYYDGMEVIVDWSESTNREINYRDCLWFFQQYKSESVDSAARKRYLLSIAGEMVSKAAPYPYLKEYLDLLKKEEFIMNGRYYLQFYFPALFKLLRQTKKNISNFW
ncbi:MAG: glycosyltransferase family 2 protein [Cyclobacterium sp.]|nr:glycosyltransferase family 2 protein [Cyclobacterium sp.]